MFCFYIFRIYRVYRDMLGAKLSCSWNFRLGQASPCIAVAILRYKICEVKFPQNKSYKPYVIICLRL